MKAHLSAVTMFLIPKYGTVKNLNQLTFKSTQEQIAPLSVCSDVICLW